MSQFLNNFFPKVDFFLTKYYVRTYEGCYLTETCFITILQSCKGQENKPDYNPKAIEFNNKAVQAMQQMDYDSALILFNKAIEIDKNYYVPYSNMTGIYLRLNRQICFV